MWWTRSEVGGQCTELYPDKPIYDIPAIPVCREGADGCAVESDQTVWCDLPSWAGGLRRPEAGRWTLLGRDEQRNEFSDESRHRCRWRRFISAAHTEGRRHRSIRRHAASLPGQGPCAICRQASRNSGRRGLGARLGAEFRRQGRSVVLVHRRDGFRAAPASVAKMKAHCEQHQMQLLLGQVSGFEDSGSQRRADDRSARDIAGRRDAARSARSSACVLRAITQARSYR